MSSDSPLLICIISLEEAPERRIFFEQGWNTHIGESQTLLGASPYYHTVKRDPEGGLVGCTRSHIECYKKALAQGKEACLIFEDDVRPNGNLNDRLLSDSLALLRNGWDLIRYHKSGICKVHGSLGEEFFHTSSLCGRCYVISKSLMQEMVSSAEKEKLYVKNNGKNNPLVPWTTAVAQKSSRHLTYSLSACEEGAFGSFNANDGFGRKDMAIAFLQYSLNYTTVVEQTVANAHFYLNLPSPLYTEKVFPNAHLFWRAYENKKPDSYECGWSHYRMNIGVYAQVGMSEMVQVGIQRLIGQLGNIKSPEECEKLKQESTGLYDIKKGRSNREIIAGDNNNNNDSNTTTSLKANEYDVIIVGGGIAGSSSYYWLKKFNKKVLILDQNDFSIETKKEGQDPSSRGRSERSMKGSSGGGCRRIGLLELAPGGRVRKAWQLWLDLQKEFDTNLLTTMSKEKKEKNDTSLPLVNACGEVIVVNIFPFGWILVFAFMIWRFLRVITNVFGMGNHALPESLQLLWTSGAVKAKLPWFFKKDESGLNWNNFGVHYEEAACLWTDDICKYFTTNNKEQEALGCKVMGNIRVTNVVNDIPDVTTMTNTCSYGNSPADGGTGTMMTIVYCENTNTGEKMEFKAEFVVLATNAGSATLLGQMGKPCMQEVETFVCPKIPMPKKLAIEQGMVTKNGKSKKTISKQTDEPMWAFPSENVYGFAPRCYNEGEEVSTIYVRATVPEITHAVLDQDITNRPALEKSEYSKKIAQDLAIIDKDLSSSNCSTIVRKFCNGYLHKEISAEHTKIRESNGNNGEVTCRYVRLRVGKEANMDISKIDALDPDSIDAHYHASKAVSDFVPGTQCVLVTGLDGYGFKYGSLFGLEVWKMLYQGQECPSGLSFPQDESKMKNENGFLDFMHKQIDQLLKKSGKNTKKVEEKSAKNANNGGHDKSKSMLGDDNGAMIRYYGAIGALLLSVSVMYGPLWVFYLPSILGSHYVTLLNRAILHVCFFSICAIYSLGSEMAFRPKVGNQDNFTWGLEVSMVWGLHFGWGLGIPILLTWMFQYSNSVNTCSTLFLAVFLNFVAGLIRNESMAEFVRRDRRTVLQYTRRVKIPGVEKAYFDGVSCCPEGKSELQVTQEGENEDDESQYDMMNRPQDEEDDGIIQSGPYGLARHPGFCAHTLQITSLAYYWSAGSILVTICTAIIACCIMNGSCASEEKQITNDTTPIRRGESTVGKDYRAYMGVVTYRLNFLGLMLDSVANYIPNAFDFSQPERSMFVTMIQWVFPFTTSRQFLMWICGLISGTRIEYLQIKKPEDLWLLEKIFLSPDKSSFIEDKVACPAWYPIRSVESVPHWESFGLRAKVVLILERVDNSERCVAFAVRMAMEHELKKIYNGLNGVQHKHKDGQMTKKCFDARSIAAITFRTFMWIATRIGHKSYEELSKNLPESERYECDKNYFLTDEEVELAIDAQDEWKGTIAFKCPPLPDHPKYPTGYTLKKESWDQVVGIGDKDDETSSTTDEEKKNDGPKFKKHKYSVKMKFISMIRDKLRDSDYFRRKVLEPCVQGYEKDYEKRLVAEKEAEKEQKRKNSPTDEIPTSAPSSRDPSRKDSGSGESSSSSGNTTPKGSPKKNAKVKNSNSEVSFASTSAGSSTELSSANLSEQHTLNLLKKSNSKGLLRNTSRSELVSQTEQPTLQSGTPSTGRVKFDLNCVKDLSCMLQPFFMSPMINFPDLFVAMNRILTSLEETDPAKFERCMEKCKVKGETAEERLQSTRDSIDFCDELMLEVVRCQHPFPIFERRVERNLVSFQAYGSEKDANGKSGLSRQGSSLTRSGSNVSTKSVDKMSRSSSTNLCPGLAGTKTHGVDAVPNELTTGTECPYLLAQQKYGNVRRLPRDCQVFVEMDGFAKVCSDNKFSTFEPERNWHEYVLLREQINFGNELWKHMRDSGKCPFMAVPFGAGPRRCAGQKIARRVGKMMAHLIFNTFEWDYELQKKVSAERAEATKTNGGDHTSVSGKVQYAIGHTAATNPGKKWNIPKPTNGLTEYNQDKMIWQEFFQPTTNHKYSGRNNDGEDEDTIYQAKKFVGIVLHFISERIFGLQPN